MKTIKTLFLVVSLMCMAQSLNARVVHHHGHHNHHRNCHHNCHRHGSSHSSFGFNLSFGNYYPSETYSSYGYRPERVVETRRYYRPERTYRSSYVRESRSYSRPRYRDYDAVYEREEVYRPREITVYEPSYVEEKTVYYRERRCPVNPLRLVTDFASAIIDMID